MTLRTGDPVDPALERVLNNLEAGLLRVELKVDKIAETHMSREEFNAFQDVRRSNMRWAVGTILTVVITSITALGVALASLT
jgi:hypothetical protein